MPYVKDSERFDPWPSTPGQLSYTITMAYQHYLKRQSFNYFALATVAGVLILTLFEFVRRIVNDYEDLKIKENGDVFYVKAKGNWEGNKWHPRPTEPVKTEQHSWEPYAYEPKITECPYVGWENFEDGAHTPSKDGTYCVLCGEKI